MVNEYQVILGRKCKRMTALRAICSKIAFDPEQASFEDLLVLFEVLLWCQTKSLNDPSFAEKFGLHLKVLAYILKRERFTERKFAKQKVNLTNSFLKNFNSFLIPKRNYKNALREQMKFIELRAPRPQGVLKSQLPPAKYIGMGYRDKGTAKNPAKDGSPSWQEIAMHRGDLYD